MRTIKRKKSSRMSGKGFGTHGSGARKNKRKSGNKGGTGLAGTGKRADHKKTLMQKLHGHKYFGKQGVTRGKNQRDTRKRINVGDIQLNLHKYGKQGKEGFEVILKDYKILGSGDVKDKLIVTCLQISESAKKKIQKAGGSVTVKKVEHKKTPLVTHNKKE